MKNYEYGANKRVWGSILEDKANRNKEKVFLYFKDEKVTYRQLNENVNRMANGYSFLGIKKGDKVSIMMPNCPEYVYHWFGLGKIGAVDNPINTAYKGDILRHLIVNSQSKLLLVHEKFLDRIQFIQDDLTGLEGVIIYSEGKVKTDLKFPTRSFNEVFSNSSKFSTSEEVKPSDPLQIIYTSGTTGPPKGVVLSHNCVYHYATALIEFLRLDENTRTYNCLPIFHANHRLTSTYSLLLDGSYAMGERYSARAFWDEIRKYQANHFHFLGGMPYIIYNQPPRPDDADNPAKTAWGGPIPVDIAEAFEKRFGVELYNGYFGMTEAAPVTFITIEEADRLKAKGKWAQAVGMGREHKHFYEVRLVDDDDNDVPDGEAGEIICRPVKPYSMMTEYFNNPQGTAEAYRNLWFHTGDLARKDEDGYFHFVDRKKDYIRRRGENISSFEIEKVANAHPSVHDSAAIRAKSEVGEDDVRIVIQLKEGGSLPPEELIDWCELRMADLMVPRYVDFIDEFPRNPVGRIEKYKLRQQSFDHTWDRVKAGYKLKR
jgi:crotonobetaine/carnitine-CoA ligase